MNGLALQTIPDDSMDVATACHKGCPIVLAMPGKVYAIRLQWIKMTDSTLGFGKKVVWEG
jgi:uncharacterized protein YhbP (UPF0306 family)